MILRGNENFRPETIQRVRHALQELNYRPNLAARSLATRTPNRIGALIYGLDEVAPSRTVQGASARALNAGYILEIVSLPPNDVAATERALETLDRPDVAGILVFAHGELLSDTVVARRSVQVPIVVEAAHSTAGSPNVSERGMRLVVEHLITLGHRRFGYIGGPSGWAASRQREAALRACLHDRGLPQPLVFEGDWSAASGHHVARHANLSGVTAVVCGNDQMALGTLLALSERGIRVPQDMSITGFDDVPESEFYQPPLTTVRVDYAAHGTRLVDELVALVRGREQEPEAVDDTALIIRSSTANSSEATMHA